MHGRKLVPTTAAAVVAIAVIGGACRDSATTGPDRIGSVNFAAKVQSVSGNQQTGAAGAALSQPIVVKVVDANGSPVSGASVSFSVRGGGGAVSPAGGISSVSGLVTTVWTLGTRPGANDIVAVLSRQFILDSVRFSATATNAPPAVVEVVSGDLQTARAGATLTAPLVVRVRDQFGNLVPGANVTFTPNSGSGTVAPPIVRTDSAAARAQTTWTLGTTISQQLVTASVVGANSVTFTAQSTSDTSRTFLPTAGGGQVAPAGSTLATQFAVRVTDRFGNAIAGDTVLWTDSLTAGLRANPVASATDFNGVARTTVTLGAAAGPALLRARLRNRNERAVFSAAATVRFTRVSAGNYFTCGTTTDDQVFCWGFNQDGQLAKLGMRRNTNQPTTAATATDTLAGPFVTLRGLSLGRNQACGVDIARRVLCWGVGNATFGATTPAVIPLFTSSALDIATGEVHTCVIDLAGVVRCGGENQAGQLGDGTTTTSVPPVVVTTPVGYPATFRFASIAAGRLHSCGFPAFDPANDSGVVGAVYNSRLPVCWGDNVSGQLGTGNFARSALPTPVAIRTTTPIPQRFDATSLVAGAAHTCMLALDGTAYCWGSNAFGQLGRGGAPTAASRDSVMTPVAGGIVFERLYAGEFHTCGLELGTGRAFCWGRNTAGQLGTGDQSNAPAPALVAGGLVFASLTLGELHSCGIQRGGGGSGTTAAPGTLYCWGDNEYGQLGIGTTSANNAPVLVPSKVANQP